MYGLIGSIMALPEHRGELIAALLDGSRDLPDCHSYVVAADVEDPSLVWVTEVWESKRAHDASLELDHVQEAIARAKHVIIGFGPRHETQVVAD